MARKKSLLVESAQADAGRKGGPIGVDDESRKSREPASKEELRAYLLNVSDKLVDESAAPVYGMAAINHFFNRPEIYLHLDEELREIARDIWLRLEKAGLQIKKPPLLFNNV